MANTLSRYATDEDICTQLRWQFSYSEMWKYDFMSLIHYAVDCGDYFELKMLGRVFNIDKITGAVTEVKQG